jgi:hypothetical protein
VPPDQGGTAAARLAPTAPPDQDLPPPLPTEAYDYVDAIEKAEEEPRPYKGLVFQKYPSGYWRILKTSGQTTPDIPASGPDIPQDAVKDNRVVISVNGIHEPFGWHRAEIDRWLLADPGQRDGVNVGQPVIGIHEGASKTLFQDAVRIALDVGYLKLVQGRALPLPWLRKMVYRIDPAVKAVHDEVRQSLQAGRDVSLVIHSGGGVETALALNILAREDAGRYRDDIARRVRVLSLAGGSAYQDFLMAGVKPENLYYTGSVRDPVYQFGHRYLEPNCIVCNLPSLAASLKFVLQDKPDPTHSRAYIFSANVRPDGSHMLAEFLEGAPGQYRELP